MILAGTRLVARVCGQEGDLGTLEAGKLANIIVVEGNPLDQKLAVAGPGRHLLGALGV